MDFVWTKGDSLVFAALSGKAKAQHLVSRCALSERTIKLISCHHCASSFILPEPFKRAYGLSRDCHCHNITYFQGAPTKFICAFNR